MKSLVPITFAAVAQPLAVHGWRPFPGWQTSKVPAMRGWSGLNSAEWDRTDLVAAISEYQPVDDYCCCLAVQPEIVAIDADIIDPDHAAHATELANNILGATPLVRIGLAPKHIRVYRAGTGITSRKLHPLETFSGSGQFIGFGWHAKAGRPYLWPEQSPLTIAADSHEIPAVTRAQVDRFITELFKAVPRRLSPTKQIRSGTGSTRTIGDRLRMLTMLHGNWRRAAAIVLSEAGDGCYNETLWAVVTSAAGRGISDHVIWALVEKHFNRNPEVSDAKLTADLESMIARTRPVRRSPLMTFSSEDRNGG